MADPYADIASPDPYASIASPVAKLPSGNAQPVAANPFNRQVGADVSYGAPLGEGGASSLAAAGYGQQPTIVDQAKAVGGRADDLVRQIASGVTLGGADRLAAGAGAVTGVGGEPGDYSGNLAKQRAATESSAQELGSPATIAANLGGNVLGAAALPAGALALPASGLARALKLGVIGGGTGAVGGGLSSPDWTDTGQTARDTAMGGATGGALGLAVPAVAGMAGKLAAALRSTPDGPVTVDNIEALKNAAYKKADDLGAAYSPQAYQGLVDKIAADAKNLNINPQLNPRASAAIEDLQSHANDAVQSNTPVSLTALDQKRQFVNRNVTSSIEPSERFFGNRIRSNIDDFIANAGPEHMAPMPGEVAPTVAQPTMTRPVNPGGPAPPSLVTFLSRMGVKDEGGDLASMGFTKFPGLVRPLSGVPMDEARRAAAEAGYLDHDTTVNDLLDQVANHPTYARGADENAAAMRGEYQDAMAGYRQARDEGRQPVTAPPSGPVASAQDAAAAITNARDLNTRYAKSQKLAEALKDAELRTGGTYSGGNIDNATRQNLRRVFKKGNFTPDETEQYTKAIMGGSAQNAVRLTGKMLNPSGWIGYSELTAALGGHPAAAGVAGVGYGAKKVADRMTQANVQKLMATILAGGKAPVTSAAPNTRAALAAAIAGSAGPQELRRQGLLPR